MTPTWSACSVLIALAACASTHCASSQRAIDTADDLRRRPDGVAVDSLEYPPEAQETAPSSAGVVALRTPLGAEAAKEATKQFLVAVSREDLETLRKLMSPDATNINPSTRARESSFYFFSRRFGRLDYLWLSNISFWQEEGVELYRASEAATLWSDTVGTTATPSSGTPSSMNDALDPSDVVVRVPLNLPHSGAGQLLGDEMTLLLRRSGGRYLVHRLVEDFTLPP